jgi:predicted porin
MGKSPKPIQKPKETFMNYKTTYRSAICVCVALAGNASAWAQQSAVTLYGVLDEAVEYVNNVSAGNGKTINVNRMTNTGATTASRWGLKGSEDLGGGLNAVFTLESGMSVDTGTLGQGGRLFGRQAFVGLTGDFGILNVGRLYTMRYYAFQDADLFGGGGHGLGSLDSGIPNARADNSISYRSNFKSFNFGANLSLGRDTVTTATNCPGETSSGKQCREWSAMAKYDDSNWGVASAYERLYGGTSATTNGLTSPDLTDTRMTLNGYMRMGDTRLGAGLLKRTNEGSTTTPKSNLYWIAAAVPVTGPLVIDGMLSELKYENSPNKAVMVSLRGTYALSKRTAVFLSTAFIKNSGTLAISASSTQSGSTPLAGGSQNSILTGIRHTF